MSPPATATIPVAAWERCRLCKGRLKPAVDDVVTGVCVQCKDRPEARRLKVATAARPPATPTAAPAPAKFSDAERSLIRAMHGYLPVLELVRIVNERRTADVGAGAVLITADHLMAELGGAAWVRHDDWTSLRQLLAQARKHGLLDQVTPQVLEDFAVVWQLSVAQLTHLKDVVTHAKETP